MYAYKNESIKLKFNYLLGHRRALCPGCRHAPQSRDRFAGGSSLAEVVVVVEVVRRGDDEVGGGGGGGGGGVDGVGGGGGNLSGGAEGRGHVMSFRRSGQNSRILSYRYHCRWLDRPAGDRTGGSSSAFGDHDSSLRMDRFTLGDPALSLTKM